LKYATVIIACALKAHVVLVSVRGPMSDEASRRAEQRLPPVVVGLGWVSFFTDAASDSIYPLLPAFLVSLGAGSAALGWVEGIAEATSAFVKLVAGRLSDRFSARKPFVVAGYAIATFVRPLLALVTAPFQVVLVRTTDRIGKGLRSAPRDAIVASVVDAKSRGAAYGFHRMMDNLGAVLGPLIAFVLARGLGFSPRAIFACAIVPGLAAMATLLFGVHEAPGAPPSQDVKAEIAPGAPQLAPAVRGYLFVVAVFTLGASADSFLLLRLLDLGLPAAWAPIVWLSLNGAKAATNIPGGKLSDRVGRRKTLVVAWVVYGLAYAAFPLTRSVALTWALIVGYGVYYGLAEGGEKAILADLAPPDQRGRAFGALHALTGIAVLPANAIFGHLYERSPAAAFGVGSGCALLAALLLGLQGRSRR
jgi:MFS family permease